MNRSALRFLMFVLLLFLTRSIAAPIAQAQTSKTIENYRLHMFDEPFRSLANRTIELMFDTARVENAKPTWILPRTVVDLDFTYEFNGARHKAEDVLEDTDTDALLVIKNGKTVYERYLNRADAATHFNSYSMAKSVNSIMVGLALADGHIQSVLDPVVKYVPELRGSGYDGTTIQNLLEMRSGVAWDDNFFAEGTTGRNAHVAAWVEARARYTDAAQNTKRAHPPGATFNYNTMDAAVVGLVVARAEKMPISKYLSERLWQPAGMESYGFYVIDGPPGGGREFTGGGFNAVLRDYGRLGLMMLNQGRANKRQILPASYVAESTKPSTNSDAETGEPHLGYAYFWWPILNSQAFTALGGEGQFIYVDPATNTVVIKLSHGPVGPAAQATEQETLSFLAAVSRWQPPR
ncbi:MAG TPA: serine hydrolase [Candidatus Acidoferrales bacterium]|nr:serine hydrolase [Candidatus Acidoferrales bacterium]